MMRNATPPTQMTAADKCTQWLRIGISVLKSVTRLSYSIASIL